MDDESAIDEWATCSKMEQVRNTMPIKNKHDDNPMMRHTLIGQFVERTPFLLGRDASSDCFCARIKETDSLRRHLANGLNTVLTGSRQIGKTTLIEHLFHQADVRGYFDCIYVDITITSSFQELVYRLVCAVIKTFQGNV